MTSRKRNNQEATGVAPAAAPTAARAGDDVVRVKVYAQDPVTDPPGLVTIEIPSADLETGPRDSQFVVHDLDLSSGVVYEKARFLPKDGAFEDLEPADVRFHQVNAFALARHALDMIESAIGRQVHWPFGPQLTIHPHYYQERNAFYARDLGAIAFFYFDIAFKEGKVFTCLSHDIVAHELGHAALDGLKPLYLEQFHAETGAFHESFGDFTAMFSALTLPEVVANVISATGGDLRQPNIAALLAEEFGYGIYGGSHYFLRNAGDPVTYSTIQSYEVHDFSVLLTATLYEILVEFYEVNQARTDEEMTEVEALIEATRHLRRIVFRAVNYLPPTGVSFKRFGQAMIAADKRVYPDDELGYRDIIKRVFTRREIVYAPEELETSPGIELEWDGSTDTRSVYQFIYRHRDVLNIPSDPSFRLNYPTIDFVDLAGVSSRGRELLHETIIEYSYTQEVSFFGWCSYFVNFGGTLAFDEHRQLVAHFAEPAEPGGERALIDAGLEFYEAMRERKQIKALNRRPRDARPTDATYIVYRLPDGRGQVRLNVCARFRPGTVDLLGHRVVHVELPELEEGSEEL
jgi:hypothetical protein